MRTSMIQARARFGHACPVLQVNRLTACSWAMPVEVASKLPSVRPGVGAATGFAIGVSTFESLLEGADQGR